MAGTRRCLAASRQNEPEESVTRELRKSDKPRDHATVWNATALPVDVWDLTGVNT